MEILVVRTINNLLKPAFDEDLEHFKKLPKDGYFEIKYTKKRNVRFHRKFFALLKIAFENQSDYRLMEDLRRDLTITSGHYEEVVNKITGEVYKKAKSISFSNMDEAEFNEIYNDVKEVVVKWLGIDNEQLTDELEQYF
jgi:hypothetical protein